MAITKSNFTAAEWAMFTASEKVRIESGQNLPQWGIGKPGDSFDFMKRQMYGQA